MRNPRSVGGDQAFNRTLFDIWVRFCESNKGVALVFLWALCEAIFFPVVPDALLIPMAVGGRRKYRILLAACIAGSALGGIVIYLYAYFNPDGAGFWVTRLPLGRAFMITNANAVLSTQGASAFLTQPLSGVSFKFYALLGGMRGFDPVLVIPLFVFARGLRMFASSIVAALAAYRFPNFFRDHWIYIVLIYLLVIGYVWFSTQVVG
jgi:membrane protein YqaA with SNARE-associated domain